MLIVWPLMIRAHVINVKKLVCKLSDRRASVFRYLKKTRVLAFYVDHDF